MKAMLRGLSATVVGAIVIAALAVAPASANGALKADLRRDISGELHGFVMFNTTRPDEIRVHVSIKSASPSVEGSHQNSSCSCIKAVRTSTTTPSTLRS